MRSLVLLACLVSGLVAAEDAPEADPLTRDDPALAVEASGEQVYRRRDLDALMLVARRHLDRELATAEESALRALIGRILVAREPLLPLLQSLPPDLAPQTRDDLVLDLLAYQPQPAPLGAPEPTDNETETETEVAAETDPPAPESDGPLPPATTGEAVAPPAPQPVIDDPPPLAASLIPLPPLSLARRGGDGGTRRLGLSLALRLGEDDDRERVLERLPLIQDAALTTIHGLDAAALLPPDPAAIKTALTPALRRAVPAFTGEVLITAIEVD